MHGVGWGGVGCSSDAKSGAVKAVKTLEDLSVMLDCDGDRVAHKVSSSPRYCAYTVFIHQTLLIDTETKCQALNSCL